MILMPLFAIALLVEPQPDPEPDVSELEIVVSAAGLAELTSKVESRDDAECFSPSYQTTACFVANRSQVYQFTTDGHPAHPVAYFIGYDQGRLEERSWIAGDKAAARKWVARAQDSFVQPEIAAP